VRTPSYYDRRNKQIADQRDECARDCDRILYSSAFRRLSGVTQVVAPEEGHVFHNRLTHSLEVAQIGTSVASNLLMHQRELADAYDGIDVHAVEAACLAHDLGHPPFGHVAEKELDELVARVHHEPDGYEGNAQSFRIVTKLAVRDEYHGLNLTRVTLNAILKYPWLRGAHEKSKKWGAYRTESKDFEFARLAISERTAGPDQRSIEAAIMTWSDDIAYSIHDTEDFYRAGLIPLERLSGEGSAETDKFIQGTFARWDADGKFADEEGRRKREEMEHAFRNACYQLQITEPYSGTRSQRLQLRAFTSYMIGKYVKATELTEDRTSPLSFTEASYTHEVEMLKELTWHYVIKNPALATQQYGHRRIIRRLFDVYSNATFGDQSTWAILPPRFKEEMEVLHGQYGAGIGHELRLRTAADAVASLADAEAHRIFQRLSGTSTGSALDPIVA
jgi:dGTPase